MRRVNGRQFDNQADADAYLKGYRCYPRWPRVGVNGSATDAPADSFEATGFWDAEREDQERMDRC